MPDEQDRSPAEAWAVPGAASSAPAGVRSAREAAARVAAPAFRRSLRASSSCNLRRARMRSRLQRRKVVCESKEPSRKPPSERRTHSTDCDEDLQVRLSRDSSIQPQAPFNCRPFRHSRGGGVQPEARRLHFFFIFEHDRVGRQSESNGLASNRSAVRRGDRRIWTGVPADPISRICDDRNGS